MRLRLSPLHPNTGLLLENGGLYLTNKTKSETRCSAVRPIDYEDLVRLGECVLFGPIAASIQYKELGILFINLLKLKIIRNIRSESRQSDVKLVFDFNV
jgi:hypothetical protein